MISRSAIVTRKQELSRISPGSLRGTILKGGLAEVSRLVDTARLAELNVHLKHQRIRS
jgi:hypothetical protein